MRRCVALLLLPLLSGCSAVLSAIDDPPAPKAGMSQVIFQRIGNASLFSGDAVIEVNAQKVGTLEPQGRNYADIPSGPTVVAVSGSGLSSGSYKVEFDAAQGKIYRFKVGPRGDSMGALGSFYRITEMAGAYQLAP